MSSLNTVLLESAGNQGGGWEGITPTVPSISTKEPEFLKLLRIPGIDSKEIDSARLHRRTLSVRKNKIFGEKSLKNPKYYKFKFFILTLNSLRLPIEALWCKKKKILG